MDMEFAPSVPVQAKAKASVRNGYNSETKASRRSTVRRRSTGYYSQTHQCTTKLPQNDEEEGEASDNSSGAHSFSDPDEHDSHSSSAPSLEKFEEGNKQSYANNQNQNHNQNRYQNNSYHHPNTPMGKKRIRPLSSNGNKSDPELGSNSLHKRAVHEAGLPTSVLRGNSKNSKNDLLHNNTETKTIDVQRPILRTRSDGSESTFGDLVDDSAKGRISALELDRGNSEGTIKTIFKLTERILTSSVWKHFRTKNPIFLLLVTGVSMMGVGLYTQSYATLSVTLDQVIITENERVQKVYGHFESIEKDMNSLQRKLLELHPHASGILSSNELDGDHQSGNDNAPQTDNVSNGVFDEIVAVKERIRMESSRISAFEKHIQATSLRDATRKYGTGVVRVQLTLDFLSDRSLEQTEGQESLHHQLILEMAPLDLMPHSVYTFLEMVDNHLYDGCSFILNAMNILKAAPLPYEKGEWGSAKQMDRNFHKLGLETVSFREYSEEYKHEQYTVGFAADGSPDFFINTGDNTEEHAGEPCFARVVSGFETVTKMEDEPLRSGMWIKKRIGIKKATVL